MDDFKGTFIILCTHTVELQYDTGTVGTLSIYYYRII